MIKFSIITVCLNAGNDLIDTINSVLNQTYKNYEIIIKDGISTDGSVDKIPESDHIRFVQKRDKNVYDAMNQAIDEVSGDFCLFINAGDLLYEPTTFEQIAEYIEKSDKDFYYGKSYTMSSGITNYGPSKISKYFCYHGVMCHQAMVIRSSFLKQRGYDDSYKIAADREWMIYAYIGAKMRFERIPIYISKYKGGGISAKAGAIIRRESEEIIKTHFNKFERIIYKTRWLLTLPALRKRIIRNPKLKKIYFQIRYKLFR